MIVGNGDIARAIKAVPLLANREGFIFFASGVSNSGEKRESEYNREKDLLLSQDTSLHIVYFGTLAIFYNPNTRYTKHKKDMEDLVRKHFTRYTIVRLGNITWGKNPHTLINYFRNAKKLGKKIEVWDTYRYLTSKAEFLHWMSLIPDWNAEMNITGKRLKVIEILKKYTK